MINIKEEYNAIPDTWKNENVSVENIKHTIKNNKKRKKINIQDYINGVLRVEQNDHALHLLEYDNFAEFMKSVKHDSIIMNVKELTQHHYMKHFNNLQMYKIKNLMLTHIHNGAQLLLKLKEDEENIQCTDNGSNLIVHLTYTILKLLKIITKKPRKRENKYDIFFKSIILNKEKLQQIFDENIMIRDRGYIKLNKACEIVTNEKVAITPNKYSLYMILHLVGLGGLIIRDDTQNLPLNEVTSIHSQRVSTTTFGTQPIRNFFNAGNISTQTVRIFYIYIIILM
eukprot:GHVR01164213.1.p1 GENE.GHVR01164213.1~~GHVR01164213.1.p1  ORF type:complete len:284 (+),score=48.72 GHVR01164213.1:1096-1947(+)